MCLIVKTLILQIGHESAGDYFVTDVHGLENVLICQWYNNHNLVHRSTKLSINEIQGIWQNIWGKSKTSPGICVSQKHGDFSIQIC